MVNILNILDVPPELLGSWVANDLLQIRLPTPTPNITIDIQREIVPLMANIANRQVFATELYVMVVGTLPTHEESRANPELKGSYNSLSKKKDILYRTIQSLEALRETASRMITGMQQPRSFT